MYFHCQDGTTSIGCNTVLKPPAGQQLITVKPVHDGLQHQAGKSCRYSNMEAAMLHVQAEGDSHHRQLLYGHSKKGAAHLQDL